MREESYTMDFVKIPLLAVTVFVISFIGIYFNVILMIPPFAATLFMIYLREGSEFTHFKNVLGGHSIGFLCAFFEPVISSYLSGVPEIVTQPIVIGIAVLLAGWLMVVMRLEHPPAIATTLLFFNREPEGYLLFSLIPVQALFSFFIGLLILSVIAGFVYPKKS